MHFPFPGIWRILHQDVSGWPSHLVELLVGRGNARLDRMFDGMLSNAETYSFYLLLSSHFIFVEESGVHSFPASQVVVKWAGFCRVHKSFVGPRSPLGQNMWTSSDYHEKEKNNDLYVISFPTSCITHHIDRCLVIMNWPCFFRQINVWWWPSALGIWKKVIWISHTTCSFHLKLTLASDACYILIGLIWNG